MSAWVNDVLPSLDFETTGKEPAQCRPVSVSLSFTMPGGVHVPKHSIYEIVNPGCRVPKEAAEVHGITTQQARKDGISRKKMMELVLRAFTYIEQRGWPLVIFNATYDWVLVHAEAKRLGFELPRLPIIDPLVLDRGVDRYRKGKRTLTDLIRVYGVHEVGGDAHNAQWDSVMTCEVLRAMVRRKSSFFSDHTIDSLQGVQAELHHEWVTHFNEYRATKGWEPIPVLSWPGYP